MRVSDLNFRKDELLIWNRRQMLPYTKKSQKCLDHKVEVINMPQLNRLS